ncbi:MJ1255/VC2487 family glycosyltransferase [Desulfobacula toluolica]|uniref:Conserved uncharacterized protein n=1 Tax=Desulfobacula toluolica (strain DSM 7467 / Tol2) TaxID=651182 RepID=K0NKQ0_DESTT|nr:MJ1255/VC2487 family glycosyltransferase [Desulfobacula toluolica]CCK81360.1 conserved uncharacterized protein [Desulfobacula toluolica Tol2]
MKILYGIQGTGNGHMTRATQIIDELQKKSVIVDVIFSGCGKDKFYDPSIISPVGFYKGFTFSIKKGGIQIFHTAKNLSVGQFARDVLSFDASGYDLVITDFEPVASMIAKKNKIPSIGIAHQYAFLHDVPMDRSNFIAHMIIKHFAPADYTIGMHWHHFNQPIVPPVIPTCFKASNVTDEKLILVYLPFEDKDHVRAFLKPFSKFEFAVYGGTRKMPKIKEDNISWHPFSKTTFYDDLATCSGVICNAGFELPAEAIFLGKKILVKPLKGQFEQVSNAMALEILNSGMVMSSLDKNKLNLWLSQSSKIKREYPNVAGRISQWVLNGNWSDTKQLISKTWN